MLQKKLLAQSKVKQDYIALLVSLLVGAYGLFLIATTLLDQFRIHRLRLLKSFTIDVHLLVGISFVYLSILLARRKKNALIVALITFAFLFSEATIELLFHAHGFRESVLIFVRYMLLPLLVMLLLIITRNSFKVKSDVVAFRSSVKLAILVLAITLFYGVSGFMLMDKSDFHQEISFTSALHHTIDQFDLTTTTLRPYTRRARIFMDSLSFVSVVSLSYLVLSLFLPVRDRLLDQSSSRERVKRLMEQYQAPSEDFFKLWPHDKHYFFASSGDSALAYNVRRGVALVLADPVGNKVSFKKLLAEFQDMCWANDWQPALIHIDQRYIKFYKDNGFQLQLIGQEAIVDINNFVEITAKNKYFRNIKNRFLREKYSVEILNPPHHQAIVDRLRAISSDWLSKPGRTERSFVMGFFSEEYLQECRLVVVRDAAQTIQAFMNLVPSGSFNAKETTYDMLRGNKEAPANINDFLLYQSLHQLHEEGIKYFNLGLCPLVGLDDTNKENSLIGSVLRFAYVNGDRLYSFSGLHRFKDKYEPSWEDRFLAYKGGVRGFSKMLNALLAAMKVRN